MTFTKLKRPLKKWKPKTKLTESQKKKMVNAHRYCEAGNLFKICDFLIQGENGGGGPLWVREDEGGTPIAILVRPPTYDIDHQLISNLHILHRPYMFPSFFGHPFTADFSRPRV